MSTEASIVPADDAGGVPFDDDFDDGAPTDAADREAVPGAPAYDSATILVSRGITYPTSTPSGMSALKSFVLSTYSGADLGCLAQPPREVRGGGSTSLHSWGIAWDWRWANPGPGRAVADQVIGFCLEHTGPLGIQAVHDYEACKYWKSYNGWNQATNNPSTGFGQSWAQWLHIERTWAAANDARSIGDALSDAGADPGRTTLTASDEAQDAGDIELPDPVLGDGDRGANVARLQDFLRFFGFADFTRSDGEFGTKTKAAVAAMQQRLASKGWYDGPIDGEYGPRSATGSATFLAAAKKK